MDQYHSFEWNTDKGDQPNATTNAHFSETVHLENIGDVQYRDGEFAGTRGQSRRLEGFQINLDRGYGDLRVQYMGHLQDIGDTGWVSDGEFIGTRGQSRRLEGFQIVLSGSMHQFYTVHYMAHLQDSGDTGWVSEGNFAGTRGQSRRVEGMCVEIIPTRPADFTW